MGHYFKDLAVILWATLATAVSVQISLKFQPTSGYDYSNLIWLNKTNYEHWSKKIDNYLEVYRTPGLTEGRNDTIVDCDYNSFPDENKTCKIDVEKYEPCVASNYFGYKNGKPCVFIELEAVSDWKPSYWDSSKKLPKDMPGDVKEQIEELVDDGNKRQTLWLTCEGESPADKENIGFVKYYPLPGFPGYNFPFTGQQGYLNPVAAIQFTKLRSGIIISVLCKIWGPGIVHNYEKEFGMVKFEILNDI